MTVEIVYDEEGQPCEPWEEDLKAQIEEYARDNKIWTHVRWHTPQELIDAGREVMGDIDIDPATDEIAQRRIQAKVYHTDTPEKDAFKFDWFGRLWLSPPYDKGLIQKFVDKTIDQLDKGNLTEGIVLVHTSETQSEWFQCLIKKCDCFCLLRERVKWVSGHKADEIFQKMIGMPSRASYSNHGSCVFYLGKNVRKFGEVFSRFGEILWKIR